MSFTLATPANALTLVHLGYRPNVHFLASDAGDGVTYIEWLQGVEPLASDVELAALGAIQAARIAAINAECRARLLTRYGSAEEQVSRAIGVYGAQEQADMQAGIAATIDASNTASNAVLAAADIAAVEAVSVSWPAI